MIAKNCSLCGVRFYSSAYNVKYCEYCREHRKKEIKEKQRIKYGTNHKKKYKTEKTITQIIKEIEEYNRENGTCVNYGEYINMLNGANKK